MIGLLVSDRKRVIVVALICAIVMNSVIPIRQVDAAVPVVVAGAAVGTFVGVVAISAIALDAFGMSEQSEKTMAFAEMTWAVSSQWAKDQVIASYNAAAAAGDKMMTLSGDVADYFATTYEGFLSSEDVAKDLPDTIYDKFGFSANYLSPGGRTYRLDPPSGYRFSTLFGVASYITLNLYYYSESDNTQYKTGTRVLGTYVRSMPAYTSDTIAPGNDVPGSRVVYTLAGSPALVPTGWTQGVNLPRVRDAFPVAVPVPAPNDFVYTPTDAPGIDVYQKGDVLVDDAGKVYSPDKVQVKTVPVPKIATDAAGNPVLDAAGNPVLGVPVGAVGVGAGAIPATVVNVKTGEAIKTETGVENPPLDWSSQPTTHINWAPLQMTGSALTRVFPFSIPWDVYAQLKIFDVKPQIPVIKVDVPEFWRAGNFVWHLKFDIDFSMFDPVAIGIRWIGNIAFTVGLALAMRRFMPQ